MEALPWVAHATVTRHWPDGITVVVDERVPAAVVETPGHGATVVDGHGHVLTTASVAPPGTEVLSAPVTPGPPGSVLGAAAEPGLAVLGAVPPRCDRACYRWTSRPTGDVTLALTGHVGVTLGLPVELPAKFVALMSVLLDVPPTAPEVIDVTVPDAPAVGPPPPPATSVRRAAPPAARAPVAASVRLPQMHRARCGPS